MQAVKANWPTGIALAAIHIVALMALLPAFFSWGALAAMVTLWYLTGAIGICLCFHRILTHRSLAVPKPLEYAMAILGSLALQGGPIEWVATHRKHHAHTDADGDPHDAHQGLWWTHIEWLYAPNKSFPRGAEQLRYAPDLCNDPFYRTLEKLVLPLQIALGVGLFALGGWAFLVWGIFARLVYVYHITWFVNSASHRFGYRNFRTEDKSTNCWWVAVLAWGEGWHNNHHAFPFSARHGMRWFEIDFTWLTIKLLAGLKLAREIKVPTLSMMERRTLADADAHGAGA